MRIKYWPLYTPLFGLLLLFSQHSHAEETFVVATSGDAELTVAHYPANGKYLLLWFAPEYGFRINHHKLARSLTKQGIEVWQSNIVESLFLPQGTGSIKQLDGKYVADLIEYAHKKTGKKILVAGDSYASLIALSGARQWQQRQHSRPYLIGAVLFSPYTYANIPSLGLPPEYMPVVSSTNIPIMIYQADKGGTLGQFDQLLEKLRQHGSPVYTRLMPGMMSLFYQEPPTAQMQANAKALPVNIKQMITVLEKHKVPTQPVKLASVKKNTGGVDIYLKPFKAHSTPIAIELKDIHGNTVIKNDFTGKVTVINFWATWCPPCIEEIPSLNRLKKKMAGQPFELISINYAEDKQSILDFIKKVNVEFIVLLDQDGNFANKWNIITYPSTFVIDTKGNIRYGVNAAIEWDNPDVVKKLKALL